MSWRHSKASGELALREPTQKAVLLALSHHANEYTGQCYPSVERLALFTGLSRRAVQQALADLTAAQLLIIQERSGRPNIYTLTLPEAPPLDAHQGGARGAPLNQGGVHEVHPGGAGGAPEHSLNKTRDARASGLTEDWKPGPETIAWIAKHCGLDSDTIAAELEIFVLRNLANEVTVRQPDHAFRLWCKRRDGLVHPPPAPRRSKAKPAGDERSEREKLEARHAEFKTKGESLHPDDPMRAKFLGWAEDARLKLLTLPPPLFERTNEEPG